MAQGITHLDICFPYHHMVIQERQIMALRPRASPILLFLKLMLTKLVHTMQGYPI